MKHFKLTCAHGTTAESTGTKYWNEGEDAKCICAEKQKVWFW